MSDLVYRKDGRLRPDLAVRVTVIVQPAKPIDQMSYEELKAEGRRRAAECGGCNRPPDPAG